MRAILTALMLTVATQAGASPQRFQKQVI